MSTDHTRRAARLRRARRRYALGFAGAVAALAALVVAGSAVSLTRGPHISAVTVDPQAATESAGSRVILRANQSLGEIDPDSVEVEPAAPFSVDAAGREIGVRFTAPLDDDTEYRITVPGVSAAGGSGPASTLEASFRTPPVSVLALERRDGDDVVYRAGLGGKRERVFSAPEIVDFRAVTGTIVVSVREEDGTTSLIRINEDGSGAERFALPGDGVVGNLQISERGGRIGYTYTDLPASPGEAPERESQLFTATLRAPGDEPTPVLVAGEAPSIGAWQFVPDASAVLLIDFTGELLLVEPGSDAEPGILDSAIDIEAVARGTYTAIVRRPDGVVWIDLETGDEEALAPADDEPGPLQSVLPMPTGSGGVDTVRQYAVMGDGTAPTGQDIAFVEADGTAREIAHVSLPDALLQTCLSPSGRYVAATVAPDLASNPYDDLPVPVPTGVETRVYEVATGEGVATLPGFDVSWCSAAPSIG
ncbi:Ig-like domain-containing protein [Microbacterium halophytorum]|uniref:Ig-like domain-containing protein n=1 Tax=Microbacterium halophytorum TaxID=2067568 RepID=UPI000CFC30F3|nr:hypothetical protein [Microbacterium halophytorum]